MTTLNLFNSATFYANTAYANVTTISSNVIVNAPGSSQVYKVNSLLLTNYSASYVQANVSVLRSGLSYPIVANMLVSVGGTIVALGKEDRKSTRLNSSHT